ncbi:MAG: von Willebrand factor type A domain-containing protein [Psychroserpens sp.]|nr:von Willebrand factor type A domain-containing protein [Psychroserpens sp.]
MKLFQLFICILIFPLALNAQEKTISGIVTSKTDGLPLPGVNVVNKSTNSGVQTDFDGNFTLLAAIGSKIEFSFIGMVTTEITVGPAITYHVEMLEDVEALEEIVVMGFSSRSRSQLTSAVQNIKSETLQNVLQGVASGVQVTGQNGAVGNTTFVRIRGNGAINNSIIPNKIQTNGLNNSEPLFVLNGKVISRYELEDIPIKKVKHVEILNEIQGSVLYGTEGSNGVLVIRTKGKRNNPNISLISDFLNESYKNIQENAFKSAKLTPLSTFSIDVDKASYSNIRRMINDGLRIPKHAVKIEEMVNYFDYAYEQPKGEHPFSIFTETVKTPWHPDTKLVRIGIQGKAYENDNLPASNLTFLIDVSGSMDSNKKLPLLKNAFKLLVNQLRDKDRVSIVVYAGAAGVVLKPTSGKNKEQIIHALSKLKAGGSTAGGAGIELAYQLAQKNFVKGGNNRVILATDGDFNVGASSDEAMENLIVEKRKSGVFLSVLGFGYGNYKDSKLEILADKGNGNHAYIDNMQEAQKVFGKEFGGTLFTIAKDVKIQVEFNPNKVEGYRLIGYENRMLADQDFVDDTKDAGELGSGHSVTALYEVIPKGVDSKYLKNSPDLKYTSNTLESTYSDELFTVKFRYKKPDESKSIEMIHIQNDVESEISADLSFASAVALFGMRLRDSKYDNNAPVSKIIELARNGKANDNNGYRSEFIRLVETYEVVK